MLGIPAAFGISAHVEALVHLLIGWLLYLAKMPGRGLALNGEMWACGLGALALALLIGHRFLVWLAARHPKLPSPWRFRGTAALTSLLLLLFGASIAMTGIVHQVAWLLRNDFLADGGFEPLERSLLAENINNVKQLKLALDGYAVDHDGRYPDSLADLFLVGELPPDNAHALMLCRGSDDSLGEPWLYLGAGHRNTSDVNTPILVQPRPDAQGRLIILRIDSSARAHRWNDLPPDLKALVLPP